MPLQSEGRSSCFCFITCLFPLVPSFELLAQKGHMDSDGESDGREAAGVRMA